MNVEFSANNEQLETRLVASSFNVKLVSANCSGLICILSTTKALPYT